MGEEVGQEGLRLENVERAVKGFMDKLYKLDQVLMKQSSSAWTETYYQEDNTPLTGAGNKDVNQVSRGANFPNVDPNWVKITTENRKFAAETLIFLEDKLTDAIDVQARSLFRVAEAVVNAKDLYIYTQLTATTGTSGDVASLDDWNSDTEANRDPIGDIVIGIGAMSANNYDVLQNGFLLLYPTDYASLIRNSKIINNPSFKTADVVSNGRVGQIAGLTIIQSTNVTVDEAMIVQGQKVATWKSVQPLRTVVIEDQGINFKIRAWEIGHLQVTDPKAIYVIEGIDKDA